MLYLRINRNEEQTYSRYHQIVTVSVTVQKAFIKAFPLVKSLVKIIYNPIDHEDIIKKESNTNLCLPKAKYD